MKNKVVIIILCWLALLALANPCLADDNSGRESLFLLGAGSRPLGMGGAYVAAAQDGSAIYYNPAGLGMLEYRELTALHSSLYEGTEYLFGGLTWPILGFGAVGIAGIRLGTDNVVFRDQLGVLGSYDYSDGQYWLSYGIRIFENLSIGANFKYLNKSLGDLSTSTGSLDFGLMAHYRRRIFIGFNAQDLVSGKLKLGSTGETIPYNIKGGLAARHSWPDWGLLLAADFDKTEKVRVKFHLGAELGYKGLLFLRGGFDRSELTCGAGMRYKLIEIDYALKNHGELDPTHRWGITFFFGPTISAQKTDRLQKRLADQERRAQASRLEQIELTSGRAGRFYELEQWDSATVYYNQLLGYQPENIEAINRLREIREKLDGQTRQEIDTRAGQLAYEQLLVQYSRVADSLYQTGELVTARLEYEKILDLDSSNVNARNRLIDIDQRFVQKADSLRALGERLIAQEQYAEAVVVLSEAQKLAPGDPRPGQRITYAKTRLLIAQKLGDAVGALNRADTSSALQQFQEILQIDPRETVAAEYVARLGEKQPQLPISIEQLRADPEYWKLYVEGLNLFGAEQYRKAIEKWEKVLEKYPGSEDTRENIRLARLRLKDDNR